VITVLTPILIPAQAASALVSVAHPFHFDLSAVPDGTKDGGKPVPVVGADVLASHTCGSFTIEQYVDMVGICHKGSAQVAEFSRIVLQKG
jgi:hypothetical protein